MKKYQVMLMKQLSIHFSDWESKPYILESDLHHFFHNLKGTAGSIGLDDWSIYAEEKTTLFSAASSTKFYREDWEPYISFLRENVFDSANAVQTTTFNHAHLHSIKKEIPFVLLIDEDLEFITETKEYLELFSFQVAVAFSMEQATELFYSLHPNLILLNEMLLKKLSPLNIENFMKITSKEFTPVIVLSTSITNDQLMENYQIGVNDVVLKSMNKDALVSLLINRGNFKKRILDTVLRDELTGAYTRRYLNQELNRLLERIENKTIHYFSVALIDLDHFKKINDTYGHLKGDEVLKVFVNLYLQLPYSEAIVCRYGGEEFALLMPNFTASAAVEHVEKWRTLFSSHQFKHNEQAFTANFSAGITQVSKGSTFSAASLLEQADQGLYTAKERGRNRTIVYNRTEFKKEKKNRDITLIIVDDDPIVRKIISEHFTLRGQINEQVLNVKEYENGIKFLEDDWFEEKKNYLVLLDGMMPEMDGMEVLEKLRAQYDKDNMIISMLTARKGELEVANALKIGADDYMVKPFRVNELFSRLERLAERIFH